MTTHTVETIEAEATVSILGVDWKATAVAEVDGNEYLYPDTVELVCLKDANGDTYGHFPAVTVSYSELDEETQIAIDKALGEEMVELNADRADRWAGDL